jgi:hypothetical protein
LRINPQFLSEMDVNSTADLLKSLKQDDLIFAYTGLVSDSITHKIIELTQFNIDSSGNFVRLKNKISFLMAECYQNVARHGKYINETDSLIDYQGAFFVRSIDNIFYIASANSVNKDTIPSIKEKLDKVNSLSPEELRLLQKQVLSKGKLSDRGGAGLGIIEMARRTGRKICFNFEDIDDKTALFFIQLSIVSDENQEDTFSEKSLLYIEDLYNRMIKENLVVLHKGDFSENSVLPIIHMIEKNILRFNDLKVGKQKLYNISVELLQNISMHALKTDKLNEGLFLLEQHNNHFVIGTSNYIENSKIKGMEDTLYDLKKLDKNELNALYRDKLRLLIDEKVLGIGIGLIYIFRKSNALDYSFLPIEKNNSLITFVIEV